MMFLNVKNVQLWDCAFSSLIGLGLIINDFQTILQPNNRGCWRSFDSTCKYHVFTRGGSETCRMAIEKDDSAFWGKNCFNCISRIPGGKGGGGGGYSQQFLNGEASPRGPTPYPFWHFSWNKCPFRIPTIDKWYSFHIPCLELCSPFNCCKCTVT